MSAVPTLGMGPAVEYVLVSDVHLTEVCPPPEPGWWEFKSPEVRQDAALVGLFEAVARARPARYAHTELIFNGDTFDFDSVFRTPPGTPPSREGLPATREGSRYKLEELCGDHPQFVAGLARFLAAGNRATFVMGNHDRELAFPEVQAALREQVARAAPAGLGARAAAGMSFEPWFVHVPGVLYAEHGQQYDSTCAYRDVLDPIAGQGRDAGDDELECSFGSVMAKKTLSRAGTFNPFNDESFLLSLGGYVRHFYRYYFPRHRLFRPYFWMIGSVVREVLRLERRAKAKPPAPSDRYERYAEAKGVEMAFVRMLQRLHSVPLVARKRAMLHELWADRWAMIFGLLALFGLGAASVQSWAEAAVLLLLLPVSVVAFRLLGRGSLALQERGRWGLVAEHISETLGVPVVAFGHSHRPERRPLSQGRGRYYNLGSWAPFLPQERHTTLARARRYLVIRPARTGRVFAAFERWGE